MTRGTFSFSVFSGGSVSFDLDTCVRCTSKACVAACNAPNLACVLELKNDVPALRVTPEEAARGACIECLACELACDTDGIGGITFSLPMPELDAYLRDSEAQGVVPGFRRT
jgi:NAD-dependent dihydropyrimidine dehydrogenase PreA subunit